MEDHLPPGLLEACIVVGVATEKLKEACQRYQQGNDAELPVVEAEVLQVHAPPFETRKGRAADGGGQVAFSRVQRRRSFIKKKERTAAAFPGESRPAGEEDAAPDISVPKDIDLVGLPQLCFPGGLSLWTEPKEACFHFLVFTDVFGNQTHGVVLQYCRPVQAFPETSLQQNGHWSRASRLYSDYGICVISKYPYYTALRDCLSCLLSQLKHCRITDLDQRVKEFSAKLALVPIPPPGDLHVVFNLSPLLIVLPSREDKYHPVVDLNLHLPFLCFQTRELLQIITAILAERRIVFFSADWARLTLTAECFMLFIHPLHWQHPLVPALSHQMLDFVMAPTAFLMGCHLSHFEEVSVETDDLILINIDDGTVSSSSSELTDLPSVPSAAAECFKTRRRGLQLHYDLDVSQQGSSTNINDLRAQRRTWQQRLNMEIQNVMLELILNIFRDVADHLNFEHRVFNSQEFLKSQDPSDQPFYKEVLESHIFHSFLKDRLNQKMDAYTRMEQSIPSETQKMKVTIDNIRRPTMKDMVRRSNSSENCANRRLGTSLPNLREVNQRSIPRQTSLIETPLKSRQKHIKQFKLPDFHPHLSHQYVQDYYADLIGLLGKAISFAPRENSYLLARYYYLRGVVNTMCGRRLDALSDFQKLNHTDVEIFPAELVRALVDSLQHEEQAQVDRRPELKRLVYRVKSSEPPADDTVQITNDLVRKFEMPKAPMPLEDFVTRVQQSGIVRDVGTIHRLFDALSVGSRKEVDPDVFRVFYTFWKETEAEAQDVNLPAEVMEQLDHSECVYKLSCSVKTSCGVGKIAMTQKRLFLLPDGRRGFVDITKFRDIVEVKTSSAQFLLLRIPSLRIKSCMKKEIFEANLKSECDLWSLMIKELWAGRKMADDHKDPQHVQQALTNVLLMDTVAGCLPPQKAISAASKLAYYDRMRQEVPTPVPKSTSETLKHRINPSLHLPTQQTVDVLLYTPGQLGKCDVEGDGNPRLWCALGHGRVVVFDAASWSAKHNCIQVGLMPLSCMLGLDQEQVWIGSKDSTIYIINTRSMSCHKQLTEHRSEVTDLAMEDRQDTYSQTLAYSCSVDGLVIVWDVSSLKLRRQFHLSCGKLTSMQLYNRTLWCCAHDCIMEVRKTGVVQRRICMQPDASHPPSHFNGFMVYLERDQIWTSCVDSSELCVWHCDNLQKPAQRIQLPDSSGVSCMLRVKNQIWVGCRASLEKDSHSQAVGKIFVVDVARAVVEKELLAHTDSVRALCSAEDRYVLSGSANLDGKIAIWKVE
ncbi:DENN domain-containing protein 3 [Engraulis encrasicolus]|uniref:DENN domain-containing protein 3 n=1 Tax=Engraulis encrasicolus TaxID=184585 RepID=UPI002FD00A7E